MSKASFFPETRAVWMSVAEGALDQILQQREGGLELTLIMIPRLLWS